MHEKRKNSLTSGAHDVSIPLNYLLAVLLCACLTPVLHICETTQKRLPVNHAVCPSGLFLQGKKIGHVYFGVNIEQERWQVKTQAAGYITKPLR